MSDLVSHRRSQFWGKQTVVNEGYFVCNRRDRQGLMGLWGGISVVGDYGDLGVKMICYLLCVCALGTSEVLLVKWEEQSGFSDPKEKGEATGHVFTHNRSFVY